MTLVALVLRSADPGVLAAALRERLEQTPALFDHDPVVIDLAPLRDCAGDGIDFDALVALLREHRIAPVAVKGGSESQMAAALAAGLGAAPETALRSAPPPEARDERAEVVLTEVIREVAAPVPTLVVERPLRSGQQVYAKGGDLIVLAAVNNGAEIIADGNIHVYAPLRGKAIAGARGNLDARIFTTCLEPELLSIAGIYRTSETALSPDVLGKPAQIRLEGEKLVMEPIKLTSFN